ncbi:MAG TPA: lactate utilization protein [Thermohalobaculum sp.]|nr:lactate utilization protein [Thermohalobaculum sp.]
MTARDKILERVRRAAEGRARDVDAVEARMRDLPQAAPVPTQAKPAAAECVRQFISMAEGADTTVSRIRSPDDLPQALAEELRRRNLPAVVRTGTDPLFDRDWGTVERTVGPGRVEEPVTMSRAELGLAETGTLMLLSGPANPVTLTFLGETHFAVLDAADVVPGFEEMWAEWRRRGIDSRTVNLVTGPSRSADIGQTLQLGAHGPVALHVFVVGAEG